MSLVNINDLPDSYNFFIEDLEKVLTLESLSGNNYSIRKNSNNWVISINNIGDIFLINPPNKFNPPYLNIDDSKVLSNIKNVFDFEKQLKQYNIWYDRIKKVRNAGFTFMGKNNEYHTRYDRTPYWNFSFPEKNSFYSFYIIGNEINLF